MHEALGPSPHASLPPELIRALSVRSFPRWLSAVAFEWMVIAILFSIGYLIDHFVAWAVITVLMGSRMNGLGVLGHEGAHQLAANDRRLNDLASEVLCFWPVMTGIDDFRKFHFAHHRYLNTSRDPEIVFKTQFSKAQWALPMTRGKILGWFLLDLVGLGAIEILKAYRLMGKVGARSVIGPLCWWTVVGALLHLLHLDLVIVIWFIAMATSFWGFYRLRSWTEHVGDDATHRAQANWWQRFLVTPYCSWAHDEHHCHPSVPFWKRHRLRSADDPGVPMGALFASFSKLADRTVESP